MLTQNEMVILSCFFPKLADLTSKDVEKKADLSHETTFRLLKKLVREKHLREKKVGKTNVYEFVKDDLTYQVFVHYVTNKRLAFKKRHLLIYKRLYEFLNELSPEGPAIIFGSYSKETETKKSDIDLLCVTARNNSERLAQEFKTKYDLNIHVLAVKPSDFKNIKKDNPVFWDDLIEYGLVLDGIDYYFKEAYKYD